MAKRTMERDWKERIVKILGKEYKYDDLPQEMKDMAGFLGFGTKLVDNIAGMKAYTDEEKVARIDKTYENLLAGKWRVPGEGVQTLKKKLTKATDKASKDELAVLKKLGLIN